MKAKSTARAEGREISSHVNDEGAGQQNMASFFSPASLLDHISEALIATDLQFRVQTWNAAAEKYYGWRAGEVIGHTLQQFIQSQYLETTREAVIQTVLAQGVWQGDAIQNCKDGTHILVMSSLTLVKDPGGVAQGFVIVNRDLHRQQQVKELLVKSEARYRALFETASDGIFFADAQGNYTDVNPAGLRLLGYARDELLGKNVTQVVAPAEADRLNPQDEFAQARAISPNTQTKEWQFLCKDGSSLIGEVSGGLLPDGRVFAILRDITERRRIEKQLIQMKRLYATLSQINQTIVRVQESQELYQTICAVGAEFGQFAATWVGLLDEASGDIPLVAASGLDLAHWPFPMANIRSGSLKTGLMSEAMRTGQVVTSEDLCVDPRTRAIQKLFVAHDYHSAAAVPFRLRGKIIGVVMLVSSEIGLFNALEEVRLLEELALDVSFALDTLKTTVEHKLAEEKLLESEASLKNSQAVAHVGHWSWDTHTNQVTWSEEMYRIFGIAPQGFDGDLNLIIARAVHPEDREKVERINVAVINEQAPAAVEYRVVWPDESVHTVLAVPGGKVTDENGNILRLTGIVQDITERKRAEVEISTLVERLNLATRAAHIGIWDWDVQKNTLIWDDQMYKLYGLQPYESLEAYATWLNGLHPDDRTMGDDLTQKVLRGEVEYDTEFRVLWPDGSVHWLKADGQVYRNEEGVAIRMVGANYDFTERRQMEELLHKSEERFRTTLDHMLEGCQILGYDWTFLYVNDVAAQNNRLPKEELLGRKNSDLFPGIESTEAFQVMRRCMEERESVKQDYEFTYPDGTSGWFEISIQPVPEGILVLSHDITARKRADAQIQRQLQRLSGLWMIDQSISSNLDLPATLEIVLQQVRALLGVDAADILLYDSASGQLEYYAGQGFRTPAICQSSVEFMQGLAGQVGLQRKTLHVPDLGTAGAQFVRAELLREENFVGYSGVPLVVKGLLKGILEIFHRAPLHPDEEWVNFAESLSGQAAIAIDNAQLFEGLQKSKAELEQRVAERTADLQRVNVELEHAHHAKDQFLANMSHELRTPLTGILGMAEALQLSAYGQATERQLKSLKIIETSGRHLLALINDILDISKIEAGKFDLHPEKVYVEEICRASLSFIKEQAQKKSITINFQREPAVETLLADSRRMKQILVNLLNNAVKFTSEHGQVTLAVRGDLENKLAYFSVSDTGIGIAPEDLRLLFVPFTQLDSRINRQYEGTGLGLALAMRLTEMHGGSLTVESEVGRGSCFTVSVPWPPPTARLVARPTPESAEPEKSILPAPNSRGNVLLVDDNEINIEALGDYLQFLGYRTSVAHTGLEALIKAEETMPRLILMDIQMPVMDGLEAIRRLRADPRFVATPIIALTALAMPGDREHCLQAGANDYLSKPVSLKEMTRIIADLLGDGL